MESLEQRTKYWRYYFHSEQFSFEMLSKLLEVVEDNVFYNEMAMLENLPIDLIIKAGDKFNWAYYFDCSYHATMENVKLIEEKILSKEIVDIESCLYCIPAVYMSQDLILLNKKKNFSWKIYFENLFSLRKSLRNRNRDNSFAYEYNLSFTEREKLLKFMSTNIENLIIKDINKKDFWNFLPYDYWTTELFVKKQNIINWRKILEKYIYDDNQIRLLLPLIHNKRFWKAISYNGFSFTIEEFVLYQNKINWTNYIRYVRNKKTMNKLKKLLLHNSNFMKAYNQKYNKWYEMAKNYIKRIRFDLLQYRKIQNKKLKEEEMFKNINYNADFFINYHI